MQGRMDSMDDFVNHWFDIFSYELEELEFALTHEQFAVLVNHWDIFCEHIQKSNNEKESFTLRFANLFFKEYLSSIKSSEKLPDRNTLLAALDFKANTFKPDPDSPLRKQLFGAKLRNYVKFMQEKEEAVAAIKRQEEIQAKQKLEAQLKHEAKNYAKNFVKTDNFFLDMTDKVIAPLRTEAARIEKKDPSDERASYVNLTVDEIRNRLNLIIPQLQAMYVEAEGKVSIEKENEIKNNCRVNIRNLIESNLLKKPEVAKDKVPGSSAVKFALNAAIFATVAPAMVHFGLYGRFSMSTETNCMNKIRAIYDSLSDGAPALPQLNNSRSL